LGFNRACLGLGQFTISRPRYRTISGYATSQPLDSFKEIERIYTIPTPVTVGDLSPKTYEEPELYTLYERDREYKPTHIDTNTNSPVCFDFVIPNIYRVNVYEDWNGWFTRHFVDLKKAFFSPEEELAISIVGYNRKVQSTLSSLDRTCTEVDFCREGESVKISWRKNNARICRCKKQRCTCGGFLHNEIDHQ